MTAAERERLLALALDFDTRANAAYKKWRIHADSYNNGLLAAYDYAGDELRALVAEMGDGDGN